MKRTILTMLAIALLITAAMPAFALGRVSGNSGLTNTLDVTVILAARVGIYLGNDITFDLSDASVTYPPAAFPGYYAPTSPAASPALPLEVFSNSGSATWDLTVEASGDFAAATPITQLYYADAGTAMPADGGAATGWTSMTQAPVSVETGGKTTGWSAINQDYIFSTDTDDEPFTSTVTITYTITTI